MKLVNGRGPVLSWETGRDAIGDKHAEKFARSKGGHRVTGWVRKFTNEAAYLNRHSRLYWGGNQ